MAITVAELNTRLTADTKDFSSGMKRAENDTEKFGGKIKSSMGTMAKWGAAAAAAGATAAVAFGVKAVMAASDLEESISKVNTVFGESAKEVQEWSKTTASSIGLSRTEALGAVGSFGNMFDQLGIGANESKKMSTSMVELAADFASFHNADITQVIDAQSAAFRGEYDSLQRFLPLINAASVEQKALAMTGKKSTKELTAQEKALAVNALMMEGAGDAAGDFARTSGGLANQMRILKAQATDFAANVGTVLIPIVLKGIGLFKEMAGALQTALGPAFDVAKRAWGAFMESLQGAGTNTSDNPIIRFAGQAGDAIDRFKDVFDDFVGFFRKSSGDVESTAGKLSGIVNQLKETFSSAFGAIKAIVVTAVDFVRGVWRVFGDDLLSFAREFVAGILETMRGLLNAISGVFDLIKAVLTGKWGAAWEALKKIVDGVWDAIFGIVRNAVTNVIPTIIAGAGQAIASAFRTAFDGLRGAFSSVLNFMIDKWNNFKIPAVKVGPLQVSPEVNFPDLPRFHQGGMVPGPRGADVPIMAQAGERVIPAGGGMSGGVTVIVQGSVITDRDLGRVVADALRDNGLIGVG